MVNWLDLPVDFLVKIVQDPIHDNVGEEQLHFGNQLFQLDGTCVRFLNDRVAVPCHCGRTAALLHLLLRLLRLRLWASGLRGAECLRCTVWSVSLPFFFATARPLPILWVSSTLSSSRACSAALLHELDLKLVGLFGKISVVEQLLLQVVEQLHLLVVEQFPNSIFSSIRVSMRSLAKVLFRLRLLQFSV